MQLDTFTTISNFTNYMDKIDAPLSVQDLINILNSTQHYCVFIKDASSSYHYANNNFLEMQGLQSVQQLRQLNDFDLYKKAEDAIRFRELDSYVLEEKKKLTVSERVAPKYNHPIEHIMQGKLYPLLAENGQAKYVLGMVLPEIKLLKFDWDTVFSLTVNELDGLLLKRSYEIKLNFGSITLSKMEIKTLIQLLKGAAAGDIAKTLHIKQTTAESYLTNIKNKFAVSNKSELINLVIRDRILHKIIL